MKHRKPDRIEYAERTIVLDDNGMSVSLTRECEDGNRTTDTLTPAEAQDLAILLLRRTRDIRDANDSLDFKARMTKK